jgi:protein-S-isoprenylcysteine O-methyltransferase Ste14
VTSEPRSLLWPTLGTLVFVILAPGSVVVLLPYLISHWSVADACFGLGFARWIGALLGYTAAVALAFHLFVVLYEEPHLRRKFGRDYEDYCRRVPRWLPRRGAAGNS